MYDESFVRPMREELTSLGAIELRSSAAVDELFKASTGTLLVVVNSICGCAAGAARPAVKRALQHAKRPEKVATVFAGQDKEATERARSYFTGYAPSSPSIALFKDGKLVFMVERRDIEGFSADQIAQKLISGFDTYC